MSELLKIFGVFFKIGSITFGGGLSMLPHLQRELVERLKWVTEEEIVDYYAIGQSTPGIIAVNVATFVGYKRKGWIGSIFSTIGIVLPSLIIISLLAAFLNNFAEIVWIQKALKGINLVVCSLMLTAVIKMANKTCIDWISALLAIISFFSMVIFKVPGVVIVFVTALIGILLKFRREKK